MQRVLSHTLGENAASLACAFWFRYVTWVTWVTDTYYACPFNLSSWAVFERFWIPDVCAGFRRLGHSSLACWRHCFPFLMCLCSGQSSCSIFLCCSSSPWRGRSSIWSSTSTSPLTLEKRYASQSHGYQSSHMRAYDLHGNAVERDHLRTITHHLDASSGNFFECISENIDRQITNVTWVKQVIINTYDG